MSSVNHVGGNSPIQRIVSSPALKTSEAGSTNAPTRPSDRVELSGISHLIQALKTNDIRTDKVANIKAQIANGTYETNDKLNSAIDKLADDLGK